MTKTIVWLAFRRMKKQKLRFFTLFSGLFLSSLLLTFFTGMGNLFWQQVHSDSTEAVYDYTQNILVGLAALLLLIVLVVSASLMKNLFSITFLQQWTGLKRLIFLGAKSSEIIFLCLFETGCLFLLGTSLGTCAALLLGRAMAGQYLRLPPAMVLGIILWQLGMTVLFGMCPAINSIWQFFKDIRGECRKRKLKINPKRRVYKKPFFMFMIQKYVGANKGGYFRIGFAVFLAICLYVPAGYLIEVNLNKNAGELLKKFGIGYSFYLNYPSELDTALKEYNTLLEANHQGDRAAFVEVPVTLELQKDSMSKELLHILNAAGWEGSEAWRANGLIVFLDDTYFGEYVYALRGSFVSKNGIAADSGESSVGTESQEAQIILYNRYINRTTYGEDKDNYYPEVNLVDINILDTLMRGANFGAEPSDSTDTVSFKPDIIADKLPEAFEFNGDITVFMPLSKISQWLWLADSAIDMGTVQFYGFLEDSNQNAYELLQKYNYEGQLINHRKAVLDWYNSMEGIHRIMNGICILLFGISLLGVVGTMIFQYEDRKRGLAILWSLGQSGGGLWKLLILENILSIACGFLLGIPVTVGICYSIYMSYRQIWRIGFLMPVKQLLVMTSAVFVLAVFVLLLEYYFIRRQNFLQDIRKLT